MPVSRLWGAGPKAVVRLHKLDLITIGDVASADPSFLSAKLGSMGLHFHALSQARDPRRVARRRSAKSIGSERTLNTDVSARADIADHLRRAADDVGRRLRRKRVVAGGVRVKLKTTAFELLTRQTTLPQPTDVSDTLFATGEGLLGAFDHPGPFRLVGIAAFDLAAAEDPMQMDLFGGARRKRKLEVAMDELTQRFGAGTVHRAKDLTGRRRYQSPNLDFLDDENDDGTKSG